MLIAGESIEIHGRYSARKGEMSSASPIDGLLRPRTAQKSSKSVHRAGDTARLWMLNEEQDNQ
jgi:hypothetical protein